MVALKSSAVDNRCHFCPKVFCCSDCRDAHASNKHAELNSSKPKCSLCFKFDLPYDPRLAAAEKNDFDRAQLVCHVVINHLPLRCKICGDKFESDRQFQTAEPCKGPIKKKPQPAKPPATPAPLSLPRSDNNTSKVEEDVFVTPLEAKLPLTPQYHIEAAAASDKSLGSGKHPDNFDSPPELARHTSTPMHLSVVSLQKHLAHPPSVPEFNLKTPAWQRTFDSTAGSSSTCGSAVSSVAGESRYYTADVDGHLLRLSLEGSANTASARENRGTPNWSSPVYPILKKQLEKQSSNEDSPTAASYRVERSILKSALLSRIDDSTRDSIEKRVRFSDQFATPIANTTAMADTSACDNDVFFEARESLDDEPQEEVKDNSPVIEEVEEKKAETLADNGESKVNASTSSSSRVVMMLLVEKTTDNAKGFSSLDLAPLIDSGLKKLEESAASIDNSKSEAGNPNSSTGTIAKATTEVTSYTRQIDGSLTETSKGCRRRASIKDTFVTRTDRIECITPPPPRRRHDTTSTDDQERELASKADSLIGNSGSHKPEHGLFSAVARVVRSALKKLPAAVTARNLSREPIPAAPLPNSNSPMLAVQTADSHAAAAAAAVALVHRSSIKRPRERIDSHDEVAIPRAGDSPSGSSTSSAGSSVFSSTRIANNNNTTTGSSSELVVTSPAAKRHRGWYRIRAREPIARMRSERQVVPTSPRGASRETQRFQQGALSIGDTFLPLPSRAHSTAHQSTQTED